MIFLLGGTGEARKIAEALDEAGYEVLVSVTTDYGASLLDGQGVEVIKRKFTEAKLRKVLLAKDPEAVIDATHPFADTISRLAVRVTRETENKYIRFERPQVSPPDELEIIRAASVLEAGRKASRRERIFSTIGSSNLAELAGEIDDHNRRMVVRILPLEKSLKITSDLNLPAHSTIAMKGPFSVELNRSLFKNFGADIVVAKAGGKGSGLYNRMAAADELDIPLLLIERPEVEYPQSADDVDRLLEMLNSF